MQHVIIFFRQRTVTRGVNKGVKEDFKLTMVKQVSRSEEPVEKLIRTFLTNERISILKALAWDKMSYLSIIVIIAPTVNFVEYTIIQNLCISSPKFFFWGGVYVKCATILKYLIMYKGVLSFMNYWIMKGTCPWVWMCSVTVIVARYKSFLLNDYNFCAQVKYLRLRAKETSPY